MTDHVIVIGAGFAGLSAATSLAEQGVRVLVLEARPSLGGRASVFTDPATGERVDNGQHVLIGAYRETFRFLRRLGTAQHVYMQPGLAVDIIDRDGRTSRLACPAIPAPLHLLVGALRAGFSTCDVTCPTSYEEDASSIPFKKAMQYGVECLKLSVPYFFERVRGKVAD